MKDKHTPASLSHLKTAPFHGRPSPSGAALTSAQRLCALVALWLGYALVGAFLFAWSLSYSGPSARVAIDVYAILLLLGTLISIITYKYL